MDVVKREYHRPKGFNQIKLKLKRFVSAYFKVQLNKKIPLIKFHYSFYTMKERYELDKFANIRGKIKTVNADKNLPYFQRMVSLTTASP